MTIREYIDKNLPKTVRHYTEDKDRLIGLPYPYVVPCASGMFQNLYYWDTYFTNKGLICDGNMELAKNNVDNMCYLVNKFGFMPNGNATNFLYNSQPPFLSLMVYDVYEVIRDKAWLEDCYKALVKEYYFWMDKRKTKIGLNRYDWARLPDEQYFRYAASMRRRMGNEVNMTDEEAARGLTSSAESGWDTTPRMRERTYEYAPADLNSLLYSLEENLSFFAKELEKSEEAELWHALGETRSALCRKYLQNADGLFMDYHFVTAKLNNLISPACFYPLYCGMASQEEAKAARDVLECIETEYGILTCEENNFTGNCQWDYPNGWAPLQLIVVGGLLNYGYEEEAYRIATKFVNLVEKCFEQTGRLWEKYNVVNGTIDVKNEYEMPEMLGWTCGVYVWLKNHCN